jgi:transposase
MFYVGFDIHTKQITVCVLDRNGKVHRRCQVRRAEELIPLLRSLPDRFEVCFEASHSQDHLLVWQLRSIPGVGLRTAEALVAFLDDPHRFANSKKIGAYFGLIPSQDQSGDTNRLGHITKEGSAAVRHLLVEAVWQATRRSPTVRAYFDRIRRDDPDRKKIAVIATAHYLARVMWSMLKHGTLWRESDKSQAA